MGYARVLTTASKASLSGGAFADSPYDGEIAFDDAIVASVLDKLRQLNLLDTTLVVVVGGAAFAVSPDVRYVARAAVAARRLRARRPARRGNLRVHGAGVLPGTAGGRAGGVPVVPQFARAQSTMTIRRNGRTAEGEVPCRRAVLPFCQAGVR